MITDKYIVIRITTDEDGYLEISTAERPQDTLMKAKTALRLIAHTECNAWPSYKGDDRFEDFLNPDGTSWGPIPGDQRRTRYAIVKLSFGFYTKVLS